jgi:hypothetical protein
VFGLGFGAFQDFGVFVGDDQKAGAPCLFDLGPFRGVDQPFDGAVDDDVDPLQGLDHRAVALDRPAGAGGFHRDRGAICGGVGIWIMQNSAPRS